MHRIVYSYLNFILISRSAEVFIGTANPAAEQSSRESSICDNYYQKIGSLLAGSFNYRVEDKMQKLPIDCLKITVTKPQDEWVIINIISVWTAK